MHSFVHSFNCIVCLLCARNYSTLWEKGSQPSGKDGDKTRKECVTTIGSYPGAEGGDGGSAHVCQVWGGG